MEPFDYSTETDILKLINYITIFSGIGIHEQHLLASKCKIEKHPPEEIVIEQGAVGDKLYAIVRGHVLVSVKKSSGWARVDVLTPGDVFGEIAILRNIPRTARITTETPCIFLTVSAKDFLEIYQYFPPRARDNIQLIVAKRLASLHDIIGRKI